jgi:hypothetical protein
MKYVAEMGSSAMIVSQRLVQAFKSCYRGDAHSDSKVIS